MATESKYLTECPNTDARIQAVACLNITPAAAGSNVDTLIPVPDGSHILGIDIDTPTAIGGSPTNINVSAGVTLGGATILAAVDAKGQGKIAGTIVAAFDTANGITGGSGVYVRVASVGGTPTGFLTIRLRYAPPAR